MEAHCWIITDKNSRRYSGISDGYFHLIFQVIGMKKYIGTDHQQPWRQLYRQTSNIRPAESPNLQVYSKFDLWRAGAELSRFN